MTPFRSNRIAAIILAALLSVGAGADPGPLPEPGAMRGGEIRVITAIDREIIRIGDLISYSMEIEAPRGSVVQIPSPGLELGNFLIRDYDFGEDRPPEKISWRKVKGWFGIDPEPETQVSKIFKFTVTAYDTGDLLIPPMPIKITDPGGQVHSLFSETARVRVVPVTSPDDLTIRDITAPVPIPVTLPRGYLALLAGALLAVFALAYLWRRRRQRRVRMELESILPAHQIAFSELDDLESMGLINQGQYERHYTLLSRILRKYLALRFHIYALEYSTAEILDAMRGRELTARDSELLRNLLVESDLVKFAREAPRPDQRTTAAARLRELIEHTREPDPEEMEEAA